MRPEIDSDPNMRLRCSECKKLIDTGVTLKEYFEKVVSSPATDIQDALPDVDPNIRELFISNVCGQCLDNMFKDPA